MVSGACVESGPDRFKICLDTFEMARGCQFIPVVILFELHVLGSLYHSTVFLSLYAF